VLAHCELQGVQSAARQRVTALTAYTQSQRQRAPELTVALDIAAPLLVLPDAPADLQHCRLLLIDLGHIGLVRHRSGSAAATTAGADATAAGATAGAGTAAAAAGAGTSAGVAAGADADAAAAGDSNDNSAVTDGVTDTAAGDTTDNGAVVDSVIGTDAATGAASDVNDSASGDSSSGDKWSLSVHGAHAAVVLDAAAYVNAEEEQDTDIPTADDTAQHNAAADNRELLLEPFDMTFEVRDCNYSTLSTLLKQLIMSVIDHSKKCGKPLRC
jgi:hypothetical protein